LRIFASKFLSTFFFTLVVLFSDLTKNVPLFRSHFSAWRSLGQSIRSNRKQNWGIRLKPRTEVFKELKLTSIKTDVHDDELDMEKHVDRLGEYSSDISSCPANADSSLHDGKKYRRARQLFQFDKSHRPAFYGVWPTKRLDCAS